MDSAVVGTDIPELTTRLQIDPVEKQNPSFGEVAGAAFRAENTVGSLMASDVLSDDGAIDYGFDSLDAMPERHRNNAAKFVGLNNQEAVDRLAAQLDREREDQQLLEDGGFVAGASMVAAGMLDPVVLPFLFVPGLNATVAGSKVSKAALTLGLSAAAGASLSELALQNTQYTRTVEQSMINVGGAAVLGGILGAGISKLSAKEVSDLSEKVGRELFVGEHQSVGAASVKSTTIEEETLRSAAGIEKILKAPLPSLRGAQSVSLSTRKAVSALIDDPFYRVKNETGKATEPSVELNIRMHDARIGTSTEFTDRMFVKYRTGVERDGLAPRLKIGVKDVVAGRGGKLSYKEFRTEIGKAMSRGDQHEIPEVAEVAQFYRSKVFEPLKKEAQELGLLNKDVEVIGADSYLTRIYNIEKINARRPEFKAILRGWLASEVEAGNAARLQASIKQATAKAMDDGVSQSGLDEVVGRVKAEFIGETLSDAEIDDIAESIINNINGHPAGLIPRDIVPTSRVLKARTLTIQDDLIEPFLERDIDIVAEHYVRTLAPEIEMTKRFGSTELDDVLAQVTDEYNVLIGAAKSEKERIKLAKLKEADLSDLRDMRDLLLHRYEQAANPSSGWARTSRLFREVNFIRMLGGMTVSAIPDLARPMMVHGLGKTGKAIVQMIRNPDMFKMSAKNVKLAGTGWDYVLNTRARRIADVGDVYRRGTLIEKGAKALSDSFGIPSLMAPWNASLKQFSGVVVTNTIIEEVLKFASGKITKRMMANLARLGIDEEMAGKIAAQFRQYGKKQGGIMLTNIDAWDDPVARHALNAAIVKDVDTIIVTPGIGDKPIMMNKELGKMVFQFKSFAFASTNRMLLLGLQQRDAAALNGLVLSVALGAVVYGAKQKLGNRKISSDPDQVLTEALDRSGALGYLSDMNNIMEKATGGKVGISALTGSGGMSRYASRNVVGAALGPSFGTAEDLRKIIYAMTAGDFKKSDVHTIRKMLPYQNLFYIRGLLDKLEDQVDGAGGLQQ